MRASSPSSPRRGDGPDGDAAGARTRADEDRALFERYRDSGDPVDRELLVERFLPLARQLAARYARRDEPFDDLFQVACLGLVKAVDRYDVGHGSAFSSYAVPTILGELRRYFRDKTWAVRVPRDVQELSLRVERVAGELTAQLGRQPSVPEIAEAVHAEDEEVLEALEATTAYRAASLDAPRHDEEGDEGSLGAALGTADAGFARAEERAVLDQLLGALSPRDRTVLRLRFDADLTQQEIGDRVGVSQMQVSRILRQSLARLREAAKPSEGEGRQALR
jgi:RNA polymerase sigma-B factor